MKIIRFKFIRTDCSIIEWDRDEPMNDALFGDMNKVPWDKRVDTYSKILKEIGAICHRHDVEPGNSVIILDVNGVEYIAMVNDGGYMVCACANTEEVEISQDASSIDIPINLTITINI